MIAETATFVMTYYVSAVVQTVSHRLFGHTKRFMPIYANHTNGHHARYPRNELLQDRWIDSERQAVWYFSIPLTVIALTLWFVAPLSIFLAHLLGLAFSIWAHVALHRHYHLSGSPLERLACFRRKRTLHFVHHRRVRTNYAIVENWIDRLIGTYREK